MRTKIHDRRTLSAGLRRRGLGVVLASGVIALPALALAAADLSIAKVGAPDPVFAGTPITYTLTVTNNGPGGATGVTVTDHLPAEVVWLSDDCGAGPPSGGTLTCNLGDLANAGVASVVISAVVSPSARGSFDNTASVHGNEADPDPGNNDTSFTSSVETGASISQGSATKVGQVPDPTGADGAIQIAGGFTYPGPLDLANLKVTITELLAENSPGGAGELATGLPKTITPQQTKQGAVLYGTSGSERPSYRLEIRNRPKGSTSYQFKLKVKRTGIPTDPLLCAQPDPEQPFQTFLTSSFDLLPLTGPGEAVSITGVGSWNCQLSEDKMRIYRRKGSGDDGKPDASLVTEPITRNSGQPDDIELNASKSSDKDGTILTYEFTVRERKSGLVVFGPLLTTDPVAVARVNPGDYRASVTVTDNEGKQDSAERGFSDK